MKAIAEGSGRLPACLPACPSARLPLLSAVLQGSTYSFHLACSRCCRRRRSREGAAARQTPEQPRSSGARLGRSLSFACNQIIESLRRRFRRLQMNLASGTNSAVLEFLREKRRNGVLKVGVRFPSVPSPVPPDIKRGGKC